MKGMKLPVRLSRLQAMAGNGGGMDVPQSDENEPGPEARVLHIAESARGGVGTYLNQIVPVLRSQQFGRVRHALLVPDCHCFMLTNLDHDVCTYRRTGRSVGDLARLGRATIRLVRELRPDIVHLHSTFAGAVARPLLLLTRLMWGVPGGVVYSPHGWAFDMKSSALKQNAAVFAELLLSFLADRIIVLSDAELRECIERGLPKGKLVRIYNGLAERAPEAEPAVWDDERLKVLFVGRFDRQKGLDILLRAAAMAPTRIAVRCAGSRVVGRDGPTEYPPNVEMLGWLSEAELSGQLAAADVVAMPSRWEGFGLVALEAMRSGVPVVASNVGGLPEVVEDGRTGTLIPPDDPDALLDALLRDSPDDRRAKGEAGRRRFARMFTSRGSAEAVASLYVDLLSSREQHNAML